MAYFNTCRSTPTHCPFFFIFLAIFDCLLLHINFKIKLSQEKAKIQQIKLLGIVTRTVLNQYI
jgi:hypothetical protein